MRYHVAIGAILGSLVSASVAAGPAASFADMRVRAGQVVRVTSRSGQEVEGRVSAIEGTTLTLSRSDQIVRLAEHEVRRIVRRGDSVAEGAALGAVAGGALGLVGALACDECAGGGKAGGVLAFAGIGTAVGALIDLAIPGESRIFEAPSTGASAIRVAPLVTADARGVLLSLQF